MRYVKAFLGLPKVAFAGITVLTMAGVMILLASVGGSNAVMIGGWSIIVFLGVLLVARDRLAR